MPAAKYDINASLQQLDRAAQPDEVVTEADVQEPAKLARYLIRLLRDVAKLQRTANPPRIDFEDVTVGTSGARTLLAHHLNGRVRWSVVGWQAATPGALFDHAMLWTRRAFFGPGTLATVAGNFTVGCRFQLTSKSYVSGARFAWFTTGGTKTVTAKLWRDSDGVLLASGTASVTNSGCYVASFTTPVLIDGSNLNVDLTISLYDGGTNYTKTGTDAAFTGLLNLSLPGLTLKALNLFSAGDARPTGAAGTELYWVEPYLSPPTPGLVEDTATTDTKVLALQSYVPGVATIRVEKAG